MSVIKARILLFTTCLIAFATELGCALEDPCIGQPCEHGGSCHSSTEDSYFCTCPRGWAGPTCTDNACLYLQHTVTYNKALELDPGLVTTYIIETLDLCANELCSGLTCLYNEDTKQCIQSLSMEDHHDSQLTDHEHIHYLEYCSNCEYRGYTEMPEYITNTTNSHHALCWTSTTSFISMLTCPTGLVWSDTGDNTKIVQCVCKDGSWPEMQWKCIDDSSDIKTITPTTIEIMNGTSSHNALHNVTLTPNSFSFTKEGTDSQGHSAITGNIDTSPMYLTNETRFQETQAENFKVTKTEDLNGQLHSTRESETTSRVTDGVTAELHQPTSEATFSTGNPTENSRPSTPRATGWSETEANVHNTQLEAITDPVQTYATAKMLTKVLPQTSTKMSTAEQSLAAVELSTTEQAYALTDTNAMPTTEIPQIFEVFIKDPPATTQSSVEMSTTAVSQEFITMADESKITMSQERDIETTKSSDSSKQEGHSVSTYASSSSATSISNKDSESFQSSVNDGKVNDNFSTASATDIPLFTHNTSYSFNTTGQLTLFVDERTATMVSSADTTDVTVMESLDSRVCPDPPILPHAHMKWSSVLGDLREVFYTCTEGYIFEAPYRRTEYSISCEPPSWIGLPLQQCQVSSQKMCIIKRLSGRHQKIQITGPIITVSCLPGYTLPDGTTLRTVVCEGHPDCSRLCTDGVEWPIELPYCKATQCKSWLSNPHSFLSFDHKSNRRSNVWTFCLDQSVSRNNRGARQTQCSSKGDRVVKTMTCSSEICQPPPYLPNARVWRENKSLIYQCLPGYRFHNGHVQVNIACTHAIDLIGRPPFVCKDITCAAPPLVSMATANSTSSLHGSYVNYNCNYGYWFQDQSYSKTMHCSNEGEWIPDYIGHCHEIKCADLSMLGNVSLSNKNTTVGTELYIRCMGDNLRFIDGKQQKLLTCNTDGQWSAIYSSCSDNICRTIPSVRHAVASTFLAVQGTIVQYTCEDGYQFSDGDRSKAIHCSGEPPTWSDSVSNCEIKSCGDVPQVPFATHSGNDHTYNLTVQIYCNPGYTFLDSSLWITARCTKDGMWSLTPNYTRCIEVFCPSVADSPTYIRHSSSRRYAATIVVSCLPGYVFDNTIWSSKTIMCLWSGQWNDSLSNCTRRKCPSLPTWLGVTPLTNNNSWLFDTSMNYTCTDGYQFSNGTSVKATYCGVDGDWVPAIDTCIENTTSRSSQVIDTAFEAPGADKFIFLSVAMFSLPAIFILLTDMPTFIDTVKYLLNIKPKYQANNRDEWLKHQWGAHQLPSCMTSNNKDKAVSDAKLRKLSLESIQNAYT